MGLVDELRSNATGYSPNTQSGGGINIGGALESLLPLVSRLRGEKLQQREQEAQFNSDLSIRHAAGLQRMQEGMQSDKQPNVVFQDNHPDVTPAQTAELGQKAKGTELQTTELKNKIGNEKFNQNLETQKFNLENKKNDQIFATKQADMQRKMDEANSKLEQAERKMQGQQGNMDAMAQYHKAQIDALTAKHDMDTFMKDRAFDEQKRQHDNQMGVMQRKLDQAGHKTVETDVNPEGTKRTTTTTSGSRVNVKGPNGEEGTVSAEEAASLPQGWQKAE